MTGCSPCDFGNAFAYEGLDFDKGRLAVVVRSRSGQGIGDGLQIMSVFNAFDFKAIGGKAIKNAFALAGVGHGVQGDVV